MDNATVVNIEKNGTIILLLLDPDTDTDTLSK